MCTYLVRVISFSHNSTFYFFRISKEKLNNWISCFDIEYFDSIECFTEISFTSKGFHCHTPHQTNFKLQWPVFLVIVYCKCHCIVVLLWNYVVVLDSKMKIHEKWRTFSAQWSDYNSLFPDWHTTVLQQKESRISHFLQLTKRASFIFFSSYRHQCCSQLQILVI